MHVSALIASWPKSKIHPRLCVDWWGRCTASLRPSGDERGAGYVNLRTFGLAHRPDVSSVGVRVQK
eukprot:6993009-Alexandrium_andersonii.AAC.1